MDAMRERERERERGTTITGYILIFSGAKNSYIAIWHHYC